VGLVGGGLGVVVVVLWFVWGVCDGEKDFGCLGVWGVGMGGEEGEGLFVLICVGVWLGWGRRFRVRCGELDCLDV